MPPAYQNDHAAVRVALGLAVLGLIVVGALGILGAVALTGEGAHLPGAGFLLAAGPAFGILAHALTRR